ncbi:MAG: DUF1445 domain-containing protein [Chloroflexota bacterium]
MKLRVVDESELADVSQEEFRRLGSLSPAEARRMFRSGEWARPNHFFCLDYTVTNLAIVPESLAAEFLLFCNRNPRPLPVLEVTDPGDPHPGTLAPEADLRTDVSRYRVYRNGELTDEPCDISSYWREDLVAFVLGCSRNFQRPFASANIAYRTLGAYTTDIVCTPAGQIHAHMVVTVRAFRSSEDAIRAIQITSRNPNSHGAPIHIGDPALIGIKDIYQPDSGRHEEIAPLERGEVVLFWACGTTMETAAIESKLPLMITQRPLHQFITDRRVEEMFSF